MSRSITGTSQASQAQPFLIGAVVGALIGVGTAMVLGDSDRGGSPALVVASSSADEAVQAVIDEASSRSTAHMRARRSESEVPTNDGPDSDPAVAGPAATEESRSQGEPAETSARFRMLMQELEILLSSGVLADHFQDNEEGLLTLMANALVETGDHYGAMAMLREFGVTQQQMGVLYSLTSFFQSSQDPQAAAEAALFALRIGPGNDYFLNVLRAIDPEMALAEVEALLAEASDETRSLREFERITMLFAAGQGDRAIAEIDRMVQAGLVVPEQLWERFLESDPAAAEERFASMLADQDPGAAAQLGLRLVRAILAQGDDARALERIRALLDAAPDSQEYRYQLAEMNAEAALAWSEERVRSNPDAEMLEYHGSLLAEAGRTQEAVGFLLQALEQNPNGGATWELLRLAPLQVAPQLVSIAQQNSDDELYGDIADALWREGQQAQATQYWRLANQIDPTDGEWTSKLAAVADGRDPL